MHYFFKISFNILKLIFLKPIFVAYRRVVVIPRGARNIRIREESNSTNQLALKTRISKEWILNSTFPMNRQTSDGVTTVHFIWSAKVFDFNNSIRTN